MTGVLDHLQISVIWATHFTIMNGERSQGLTFARKQRPRPHRTNSKRQEPVTIVFPNRVFEYVTCIYWLPSINSCAARSPLRANKHRPCLVDESWKTRRSCTIELLSIIVWMP